MNDLVVSVLDAPLTSPLLDAGTWAPGPGVAAATWQALIAARESARPGPAVLS